MNPQDFDYSNYPTNFDPAAGAVATGVLGITAGIFLFIFLFWAAFYVYLAICLMKIAGKTGTGNRWFAWIPILNMILMLQVAKKPVWWIILMLIPLVNIVIAIIVWMAVAEAVGKPNWLGILMIVPVANVIIPGYLAFSKMEGASVQTYSPPQPPPPPSPAGPTPTI